jgi:hypothetical protein
MFWRIVGTLGAGSFVLGGFDIASTSGCESVDFGGQGRSTTYSCTFGLYPGDLSAGAASGLMIFGGLGVIGLMWAGVIRRSRRGY